MEYVSGNIFIRPNVLTKKGDVINGHVHNFDHTSVVFKGSVHARKWNQLFNDDGTPKLDKKGDREWLLVAERDIEAPGYVLIEANSKHDFVALQDNTEFWCVYAHRDPQSHEVVQEWNGWIPATQ